MLEKLSRLNIRIKIRDITLFFMIAKTQTVNGIVSYIAFNQHIILWDLDDCSKNECISSLHKVQRKYNLGEIFVISDRNRSYGAICFTIVPLIQLLRILIDTQFIDVGFISYTAKRNKATLRLSRKKNRPNRKLDFIISGRHEKIPQMLKTVVYDTGLVKDGLTLKVEI